MPTQPTFTCATCDARIAGNPTFHLGLAFCCAGCAADGPCMCSYDGEDSEHPVAVAFGREGARVQATHDVPDLVGAPRRGRTADGRPATAVVALRSRDTA